MDINTIIEGTLKFRDGKKWKSRWCVLRKLSPVADCVHVQLYRDSKDRYNNGQTKASLSLQYFLAIQSGFTLDKESNTIAILCEDVTVIFAFDTREQLIQWQAKLAINLGEEEQFLVQISRVPPRGKIVPGPARLHVLDGRFCLTDGVPPRLLGHWQIAHLRKYGVINNRFCFEGGSQCGRGEGLHVLLTSQGEEIARSLQEAAQGGGPQPRLPVHRSARLQGRERSISSSRTEANLCDRRCPDSPLEDWDHRSRSQENLCWSPLDTSCHLESVMATRPRCRSCHVKMARSSTVACTTGTGFTWTMESSCGDQASCHSSADLRLKMVTSGLREFPCNVPPRPPKKKPTISSVGEEVMVSKRPRPSPSMPAISRHAQIFTRDTSPGTATELCGEYYDTPKNVKTAVCDQTTRIPQNFCGGQCEIRGPFNPSVSLAQDFPWRCGCECYRPDLSCSRHPVFCRSNAMRCEDEPTSLSSDPGCHVRGPSDPLHSCCYYMNVNANPLYKNRRCVKSVTFSELPHSTHEAKPNYVNIDFAESLKFYENCKDCFNKHENSNNEQLFNNRHTENVWNNRCSTCNKHSETSLLNNSLNRPFYEESQGYIQMASLANITHEGNQENQTGLHSRVLYRSKSSVCLHTVKHKTTQLKAKSISDPELHVILTKRKCYKLALSKIIDFIKKCHPISAQEIQKHAKKSMLSLSKNRTEESQYHSDDTISSDTMVNTTNDISEKGSLNSVCSENTRMLVTTRFISTSELNIPLTTIDNKCKTLKGECLVSDLEKYKEHLRSLEVPQLPLSSGCIRFDNTCCSAIRRSCTVTFKPGHNRDSSSSNDSGVSTASLRLRRTDFTEFEMPVTTALSAKLLREYTLSQSGKSSSDLSLPRRSKSIDPLGELVFQFQDSTSSTKSTSALLNAVHSREGKLLRFIDAPSTSSGTSDLSDYMDNLSISSYSSNDHTRIPRCTATTLKPRSGKEYLKIDRLGLSPTQEGTSCAPSGQSTT